jgi:hypothetical protein
LATTTADKRVTVYLPEDLVEPLERFSKENDRSVSAQIVSLVRQYIEEQVARREAQRRDDWRLLQEAVARADRGETYVLRDGVIAAAQQALVDGKPTDEVMAEWTRGAIRRDVWEAQRAQRATEARDAG